MDMRGEMRERWGRG